jgi:predicted protein tyrosine phosphatase
MHTDSPFDITVCGIEELTGHCARGVTHVLSILDPDWPVPEAFGSFGEHERLELRFNDITEDQGEDLIPPGPEHVVALLEFARDMAAAPEPRPHLLVHCHAGISRSTAAMALVLAQARPEAEAGAVLAEVARIRPQAWPNLRLLELGDAALGRGGALVRAATELYRAQLLRRPELATMMRNLGRERELAAIGA